MRGMTELLDLRGQCAGAALIEMLVRRTGDLAADGEQKTRPVDGRIAAGAIGVEQVLVFDVQQGLDHQGRNVGNGPIRVFRKAGYIQGSTAAIEQGQPGHGFFGVHRIASRLDPGAECGRLPCLR